VHQLVNEKNLEYQDARYVCGNYKKCILRNVCNTTLNIRSAQSCVFVITNAVSVQSNRNVARKMTSCKLHPKIHKKRSCIQNREKKNS
jgi:hypothetical protein